MTPTLCCGFECGVDTGSAAHGSLNGTCSYQTTTKRSGDRALRVNPTASTGYLNMSSTGAGALTVGRVYLRFATLPAADCTIISCFGTTAAQIRFKSSDSKIYPAFGTTFGATGVSVTTGVWYCIDFSLNDTASAGQTAKFKVDGGTEVSTTGTGSGGSGTLRLGIQGTSTTADFFFDDLVVSTTSGDYPIGAGKVNHFVPTADGAHNIAGTGDFQRGTSGTDILNATTTAFQLVDDVPLPSSVTAADSIAGIAPANPTTDYVECVFGPAPGISTPTTGPRAVDVILAHHQAGTQTGQMEVRINDNGTLDSMFNTGAAAGVVTLRYARKHYADPPSAASVWNVNNDGSNGDFRDLRFRFYAQDAAPDQFLDAIMIEAEFTDVTNTTQDQTIPAKSRISKIQTATIPAKTRIQKSATQTIPATSRIRKIVSQTITALSKVLAMVNQTIPAISRIRVIGTRTIPVTSRIQKVVDQTTTTISTILQVVNQTVPARSRISKTVPQTIPAISNIRVTTPRTIQSRSRIQKAVLASLTAISRITDITQRTVTAISRILDTAQATITTISRITDTGTQTIPARSRIQDVGTQTIPAQSRITDTAQQTVTAISRIRRAVDAVITALSRIATISTQTILSQTRIAGAVSQNIPAKSRITATTTRTIPARSRIATIVSRTITAISRISLIVVRTITSRSRIAATVGRTITAVSNIVAITATTQTITAISRVQDVVQRTITSLSRIQESTQASITAVSRITDTSQQTIPSRSRITDIVVQTINSVSNIRATVTQTVTSQSRIHATQAQAITCVSSIVLFSPTKLYGPLETDIDNYGLLAENTSVEFTTDPKPSYG